MAIGGFIPTPRYLNQLSAGAVTNVNTVVGVYDNYGNPEAGYGDIPISTMTITANRTGTQRTTVTLTVTLDPITFWPRPIDLTSPLSPNGNELYISCGYVYPDGSSDMFLQGKFPIVTCTIDAQGSLTMSVSADDRAWSIGRRGLTAPYTVPEDNNGDSTGTISVVILNLLQLNISALPAINYNVDSTNQLAPPNTYSVGQDPWQAATDLATSTGWELYLDPSGNVTAAPPASGGTSIWNFSSTPGSQIALTGSRVLTADQIFNDFFVITANSDSYDYFATSPTIMPPVQSEMCDQNPDSPTYVSYSGGSPMPVGWTGVYQGGTFGDIVQFIQSSVATNSLAAAAEAQLDLTLSLGKIDILTLDGPINPAVQIDDFCNVLIPRIGLTSWTQYVVDGFSTTYALNGKTSYTLRRVIQ